MSEDNIYASGIFLFRALVKSQISCAEKLDKKLTP